MPDTGRQAVFEVAPHKWTDTVPIHLLLPISVGHQQPLMNTDLNELLRIELGLKGFVSLTSWNATRMKLQTALTRPVLLQPMEVEPFVLDNREAAPLGERGLPATKATVGPSGVRHFQPVDRKLSSLRLQVAEQSPRCLQLARSPRSILPSAWRGVRCTRRRRMLVLRREGQRPPNSFLCRTRRVWGAGEGSGLTWRDLHLPSTARLRHLLPSWEAGVCICEEENVRVTHPRKLMNYSLSLMERHSDYLDLEVHDQLTTSAEKNGH
ncbi:hypothetical protein MC885_020586 [Smutsia gigantea]|nr:hypothetical protein MC885_020586 [Smutsia gigantea]